MIGPADLIFGVLLPALIAGIVLLVGRGARSQALRSLVGAIALGGGYLVAFIGLHGPMSVPALDHELSGKEWIAWFVLAAIVLAPIRTQAPLGASAAQEPGSRLGRALSLVYVALFSVSVIRHSLPGVLAETSGLAVRLGLTLLVYALWKSTDRLAERVVGAALPAALVVAGTGISIAALLAHSAATAQLVGAACAGLGAATALGFFDPQFRLPIGAVAIAVIVFAGGLASAALYDLPPASWVLLALAPLMPWLGELRVFATSSSRKKMFVDAALTAVPVAIAVAIAYTAFPPSEGY